MSLWFNSKHKEYYGEDGGYVKEYLEDIVKKHTEKTPLDHPDGAVTTAKIANGALTTDKIANNAITEPKLADGSVSERTIASDAVTSGKIKDKSVTDAKIGERTVTINKKSVTAQITSLMQSLSNEIERVKSDSPDIPEDFSKLKEQIGNIEDLKAGDGENTFEKNLVSAINSLVYGQSVEAEQLDDYNENWEPSAPDYDHLVRDGRYFINHYREGYGGEADSLYYVGTEILSVAYFKIDYKGDQYTDAILAVMLQCSVYNNCYKFRFGIDDHEKMIWNDWTELAMSDQVSDLADKLDAHKSAAVLDHPDGSVTTAKIADGAVTADKIPNKEIDGILINDKTIDERVIKDKAVTNAKIGDKAISGNKIAEKAVGHKHLEDDSVYGSVVKDGSIDSEKLAAKSVTHEKMADNSVWRNNIGHNAVEETNIADGSVTTAKIANGAVTNAKLADNAVCLRNIDSEALQKFGAAASAVIGSSDFAPRNFEWLDKDTGKWEFQFKLPKITIKDTVFGEISLPEQELTYSGQASSAADKDEFYIYAKYELESSVQKLSAKPFVYVSGTTPQILKKRGGAPISYIEVNENAATAVYVFLMYVTTETTDPTGTSFDGEYLWYGDTEITFLHS